MKRNLSLVFVIAVLVLGARMLLAQQVDMSPKYFGATAQFFRDVTFGGQVNIATNQLYVGGVLAVTSNMMYSSSYNIPVANMTNGAGTLGSSIGGNIPKASITNALSSLGGMSGVVTNFTSTSTSNVFWYYNGVVTNWSLHP